MKYQVVTLTQVSDKKQKLVIPVTSTGHAIGFKAVEFGEVVENPDPSTPLLKSHLKDLSHLLGMLALEINSMAMSN